MFFDTITVEELLKKAPHNYLRSLGYNIEIKYLVNKRDTSIDQMSRRLTDTDFLKKVVEKLSWTEKEVLKLIMSCPSGSEADRLNHQVGKLLKVSTRKSGHELATALNKKGLVFEGRTKDEALLYFIPGDLYLRLSEVLVDELWNPLHLHDGEDLGNIHQDGLPLIRDIYVFLDYLKKNRVRVTQKDMIFKKTIPKIIEQFEIKEDLPTKVSESDYPERFGFICEYCQSEELAYLEGNRLSPHHENIASWIALTTLERVDRVAYFAVGGVGTDWETGVFTIRFCQPGVWFSTASLIEKVSMHPLETPKNKRYYYSDWENIEIDYLFFRLLSYSGVIDLASDRGETEKAFRLTNLGAAVLKVKGYEDSFKEDFREEILLESNFELMVPRYFPLNLRFKIDQFADLKSSDQMNLYEITQESIYRGLEEGLEVDDLVCLLKEHCKTGVPQNVEYSIKEWASKYGAVYFLDTFLLMVEDENLAREIQASKKIGKYIKDKLFPTALIVSRSDYEPLLSALRDEGYMPRAKVEGSSSSPDIVSLPGPRGVLEPEKPQPYSEKLDQSGYNFKELTNFLEEILEIGANSPQFLEKLEEMAHLSYPDFMKLASDSKAFNHSSGGDKRKMRTGPNPWLEPSGIEIGENEDHKDLLSDQLERLSPAKVREGLEYAVDNELTVLIEYLDQKGNTVVKEVDPYDVWKRGRNYYLQGFSYDDGGEKTFKLENIKALGLISEQDKDDE